MDMLDLNEGQGLLPTPGNEETIGLAASAGAVPGHVEAVRLCDSEQLVQQTVTVLFLVPEERPADASADLQDLFSLLTEDFGLVAPVMRQASAVGSPFSVVFIDENRCHGSTSI